MEKNKKFWSHSLGSWFYRKFSAKRFFAMHKYITNKLLSNNTNTILDIACGPGDFLFYVHSIIPNAKLFGTDIAPGMVAFATKKLKGIAEIIESIGEVQPFADESFDVVTIMMAFHHFEDKKKALLEVKRILKPNGKLLIADVMAKSDFQKKLWNFLEKVGVRGYVGHYKPDDLKLLNNEVQFDSFYVEYVHGMPKRYRLCTFQKSSN